MDGASVVGVGVGCWGKGASVGFSGKGPELAGFSGVGWGGVGCGNDAGSSGAHEVITNAMVRMTMKTEHHFFIRTPEQLQAGYRFYPIKCIIHVPVT